MPNQHLLPSLLLFRSLACIVIANDKKEHNQKSSRLLSLTKSVRIIRALRLLYFVEFELYKHPSSWRHTLLKYFLLIFWAVWIFLSRILNTIYTHVCGAYLSLSVSLSTAQPNSYLILEYMHTNSFWKTDG